MLRTTPWVLAAALLAAAPSRGVDAYSIKTAPTPAPKELKGPVAKVLGDGSVQFLDAKGDLIGELWFRKEVPAKATPAQLKTGLTYRQLEETTLLGAVRFARPVTDYRKQKINPGVYTLRLGFQPMDGDHTGTAPYTEFCLLVPAAADEQPGPMKTPKELQELSNKAVAGEGSHPAVFLLVPNRKPADAPKLAAMAKGTWVLTVKEEAAVGDQKAPLGIGLTLVGHAE